MASTYAPYEIIVVNDRSTEEQSLEVLNEIEGRRLSQLRVVHTENQGLVLACNTGTEAARGEFIAFVEAGDWVAPEFFARTIAVLRRYPNVACVYSWVCYCERSSAIWPTWNAELPYLLGYPMLTPLVVVRRSSCLRWLQPPSQGEYPGADFPDWIALLATEGIGVSLPYPFVHARLRSAAASYNALRNQQLYLYEILTQRYAEAYREWGVELFNLQNANGPGYLWNHPAAETAAPAASLVDSTGVSWHDRELGGRLVSRVRKLWLVRHVLHYPRLKKAIKATLGL